MVVISVPNDALQGFQVPPGSVQKDYTKVSDRGFSLFGGLFICLFIEWSSHVCGNSQATPDAFIIKASEEILGSNSISWAQTFMFCLYYCFSQAETGEGQ